MPKTKTFVTSGHPLNSITEVFDVRHPNLECEHETGFNRFAAVGGLLDGKHIVVCGGKGQPGFYQNCNTKDLDNGNTAEIQMANKRYAAASVNLNDSVLWIVGGREGSKDLDTSEFVKISDGSSFGPKLPFGVRFHCMIYVSSSLVFLIGGDQNSVTSNQVWNINPEKEFTIKGSASMTFRRKTHACGKLLDEYGNVLIMVAGGKNEKGATLDTTEIFNVTSNEWKSGKMADVSVKMVINQKDFQQVQNCPSKLRKQPC